MKLAIDARELQGRPTGVGRVLEGLLGAWPAEDEIRLICREEIRRPPRVPADCALDMDVTSGPARMPGSLWEQLVLPRRVRTFGAEMLLCPAYGMPRRAPCATVVGMHDCAFAALPATFSTRERLRRRWAARIAARRAVFLFMGSRFAATEAAAHLGVAEERLLVLPYGVAGRFRPTDGAAIHSVRARYHLPERPLLLVGAHLERRGLPGLARAVTGLAASRPGVELCRLGDPPSGAAPDGGRWLGYVDDEDLPALYSAAEVVLYPSLYEGFGLPVLEALACGTPVLTSDVASLAEVYRGHAHLLPASDLAAWTDALGRLLDAPAAPAPETRDWAQRRDWQEAAHRLRERMESAVPR